MHGACRLIKGKMFPCVYATLTDTRFDGATLTDTSVPGHDSQAQADENGGHLPTARCGRKAGRSNLLSVRVGSCRFSSILSVSAPLTWARQRVLTGLSAGSSHRSVISFDAQRGTVQRVPFCDPRWLTCRP
jgi:hypothetical protein